MENNIDLAFLRQLVGGDEALAARFLELFKTEMPKQLTALETCLKNGDFTAANTTAHSIKGQLRTLGLEQLADIALELENQTEPKRGNVEWENLLDRLKKGIGELLG